MTCCRDSPQLAQASDIVQQQPRKRRLCLKTYRSTTHLYVPCFSLSLAYQCRHLVLEFFMYRSVSISFLLP